ncbi:tyrosine-protein kinase receptor UFO-like isoform X2 [Acipenser ruthenus]|uniref:tyrosine-protein kinase receptor UFO-like isoform X2 n=1 Tax=Acipenser ruthenus TaxID=7906 RepID=UPI00274242DD|nr:tyrosine-protein kinase receptor UFO-like isoform X2 [Acipenser ruthenus]
MGRNVGCLALTVFLTCAFALRKTLAQKGWQFEESPGNVTSSLGKPVRLRCGIQGFGEPPEIFWTRDGEPLEMSDTNQLTLHLGEEEEEEEEEKWLSVSELWISSVQLSDMGGYRCALTEEGGELLSEEGYLELEGLPHFSEEPRDFAVVANRTLNLSCRAHGPPEPVRVIWLQDGAPLNTLLDPVALSPSTLTLRGLNRSSSFSCEAHNKKGVATSTTGKVTVIPDKPQKLKLYSRTNRSLEISWEPGFGGVYPITVYSIQVSELTGGHMIYNQNVKAPPPRHLIPGLVPFTEYRVRLSCRSSEGGSDWTDWVTMATLEGVPSLAPTNVSVQFNGSLALVKWEEPAGRLNGVLRGYRLAYQSQEPGELIDTGNATEMTFNLSLPGSNLSVRVCAYTGAGQGPWSLPLRLASLQPEMGELQSGGLPVSPGEFSWHWWYVVMAVAVAIACTVMVAVYVSRLHRKETQYGEAFEPMMERGELVVRYRARRSYSRRTTEATLNTLGISDDLKEKLQDVMVDRHRLTLGKTLGEGEFGSVMEGQLSQEDYVLKVAVKTMKTICTHSEMEDFLREAACMKEFDHRNVMRLIGVCLQSVESEGFPSPVVILPFMKHGDLHSYLLYSRLGDSPVYLPVPMLVKFMTDIARGMEYLSNKNFIHRDLAARNCMLNENMTVCVADFGLSKKIYNGDYYRQGRISKMPVKWIAIESLADRVYTSKSDVWSFGVTMWEISTRGQTPYPGVENSEIYDYLRQGNRLKPPPDCLDTIYALMFSCWLLSPKERPRFETLRCELEKALEEMPSVQEGEEILYVNMEESAGGPQGQGRDGAPELGAVGGQDPSDCFKGPPFSLLGPPLKGGSCCTSVDVHPKSGRYVLFPAQQESSRMLRAESRESLGLGEGGEGAEEGPQPPPSTPPLGGHTSHCKPKAPWQ